MNESVIAVVSNEKMGDLTPVSYYCTETYLEKFLGDFKIQDRPKRMMHRFLDDERRNISPPLEEDNSRVKFVNQALYFSPRDNFLDGKAF